MTAVATPALVLDIEGDLVDHPNGYKFVRVVVKTSTAFELLDRIRKAISAQDY